MSALKPFRHIHDANPLPFDLYLPAGNGAFPLICITPLLGRLVLFEDLCLERCLARFFAKEGLAAAVMARPIFEFNPGRGLGQLQEYLDESVARNRSILNRLAENEAIDAQNIGTLGISFGAVVNTLWASSDPRLKAHILALGGGHLADIFVTSKDPLMRSYLKAALESERCSAGELRTRLERIFTSDPLKSAAGLSGKDILLVLALFDRVIRFRNGLSLRRTLRNPRTFFLPLGHYTSILGAPLLRWEMLRFFREKLKSSGRKNKD